MEYEFLDKTIDKTNIILPNSDKINPFLLRNNYADLIKGIDFIGSEEKFLYIHGFMGTGKRQFVNYICEFLNKDVIKLEYYCKEGTVCDDILLAFNDVIENLSISKAVNFNAKITTLAVKFKQQISSIKKPFLIILHSFDDIQDSNAQLIKDFLISVINEENVKLILSTRAMMPSLLGEVEEDKKLFLKAFTKEIFKEFLTSNQVVATNQTIEDFYKYTRGYYYYVALSIKIIQAMKIDLNEFLQKYNQSGMTFDSFLGATYINLIPTTIRNFFWFLRTIRHGLSLNALAIFELYDEFSIEYLKTNLMVFQSNETLYVQDYFLQKIDISIPKKTEIKLHKYIIGIYESQLKAQVKDRAILISRQALRAEIEYHNTRIYELENNSTEIEEKDVAEKVKTTEQVIKEDVKESSLSSKIQSAMLLANDKKYTDAIDAFKKILEREDIDLSSVVEIRYNLAKLYKTICDYQAAQHYYELVETYYRNHRELINLNYLYYDMTDLYFKMYKNERAVETIKKVIYSVDTPQSLMVSACTLLGNIYSEMNNARDAYSYYKKALESLDENVEQNVLADLYFKYALANDDNGDFKVAYEYYNKCITISEYNPYKALAYSNMASCYLDNENLDDAITCFKKAYEIEKSSNNYDGIYYNASKLAKLLLPINSQKAYEFMLEAKKSAEFINEDFYILESSLVLGDYYYDNSQTYKEALREYFRSFEIAKRMTGAIEISKIESRINDMKLRMDQAEYKEIEKDYAKNI